MAEICETHCFAMCMVLDDLSSNCNGDKMKRFITIIS